MSSPLRIAFLTNLIPPYHKPLYRLLTDYYQNFHIFISTPMETNRPWNPDWKGLHVTTQKGATIRRKWRHPDGFEEPLQVHLPLDTIPLLAKFKPDVIVSVEMGFRTLLAYVYARFHPRSRLLIWSEVTAITERGRGGLRLALRRFLAKRVDGFLALGPAGVSYVRSLGTDPRRVFEIPYSTNLAPFSAIPLERHGPAATRLLFSGQLVSRKGLEGFCKDLAQWALQNTGTSLEFHLVGSGPLQDYLTAFSFPANVKLVFIGPVQYHQLPPIYADAGIFVLPTLADTWGVVVNEALASGLPVLGSINSQAVEQMVEDGISGWTFRPTDAGDMLAAISRALSTSEADLNEMRVHARQAALKVTPQHTAQAFQQALSVVTHPR